MRPVDGNRIAALAVAALLITSFSTAGPASAVAAPRAGSLSQATSGPGVPPGYAAARAAITVEGRAIVKLAVAMDAKAIHARLVPASRREISEAQIAAVLQTLRADLMRGRTVESALPLAPDSRFYAADHRTVDGRTLTLSALFDARGGLTSVALEPRLALLPDPRAGYRLRTRLRLPFLGRWWVFWGGDTQLQNYHVVAADQRHAMDLMIWRNGSTHRGAGAANSDYYVWNHRVRAPASAVVVEAVDGVRDNTPLVDLENSRDPAGNHVVLRLADGEYALLAHLRQGSVRVKVGQRVSVGQVLGLAGNSGNSSEPHLHFHVQDRAALFGDALGLPLAFRDYAADGRRIAAGSPVQGQFIASLR